MDKFERDQLKAIMRELLLEMLQPASADSSQWQDLNVAWQTLGYPSYDALYKDVHCGLFRWGKEVYDRRKPGARLAKWQIDIAAARKRLQEDPANRRGL